MKSITLIFVLIIHSSIVLSGCGPKILREQFVFDYKPTVDSGGSTGITIAIVKPQAVIADLSEPSIHLGHLSKIPAGYVPLLRTMALRLGSDFEEMLTAYGYNVKGPFSTFDEMTYLDKEQSDLVLLPQIVLTVSQQITWQAGYEVGQGSNVTVEGGFRFAISESMTQEKLWVKNIVNEPMVSPIPFQLFGAPKFGGIPSVEVLMAFYPGVYNNVGQYFLSQYNTTLDQMANHLHPKELEILKRKAIEVREKVRF